MSADILDDVSVNIENQINRTINNLKNQPKETIIPVGKCIWCDEIFKPGNKAIFCDTDCRDDYHKYHRNK